ncbi:DUF7379 domain-containing protein [Puia sp. P3]|uniref:DUF7379 domain-containing protein n=1 Tax=Puia sp. P3 TaxID=3423952 RepID=UPI003D675FB1
MTDLAKHLEEAHLKNDRGLFRVDANFGMTPFNASEWQGKTDPALLFIHGTNSSSAESFFNDLPSNGLWEYATRTYKSGILAFQHESLSKSPLRNAIDLIDALPENIELHIITHSRGGLVGEILARCSDDSSSVAFSEKEIDYLEKEGRDQDVKDIKELQQAYLKKRFKLSRFIRVACPAGGTTILSKRLDHFLNFSLHLIGVTTAVQLNPIFDATKNLLMAAVGQKDNLKVLPGLEAMNPDSPFINILNNQETVIQRPVIAISGNSKPSVNPKGLLIIAGRLFFMKQNDLVVNTDSMYAGSKRKNRLKYFFDSGTNVDHFHYFRNERTNAMIALALQTAPEDMPADFAEFERGGLVPGGEYYKGDPSGKRPIAVLLPGIMGSCIDRNGDRLWLKLLSMGFGSLMDLDMSATGISVKNIIETSYRRLGEALSTDYDVVTFAFDWRKSSQDAAALLDKQIRSLLALKQPIKVVAHSLGGVVVRDLMVFYPGTWQQLNASPNFQLVFLGSPLLGSFRILNVLMGEDSIIRTLSRIDLKHSKRTLLNMFSQFPGILGLLPLTNSAPNDFASANTWVDIAVAFGDATWPVPRDTVSAQYLSDFRAYRTSVIAAMPDLDFKNAVYIAGKGRETACGYRIDDINGSKELVFLSTGEGDESVTWDMGIPQSMIRDNNVYYVNHTHGDLSDSPDMFSGIKEILGKGRTSLFTTVRPLVRGEEKIFRKPQTADFDLSEAGIYRTLMGLSGETNTTSSVLPVKVSVAHGDLKYAEYPVLAGHFEYDSVLYAEKRIDQLLGGQLEERNKLGIYPGALGTCDVLLTYKEDGFQGAIIAGIGQQDKLTAFDLARTAEQAASKYLLIVNGRKKLDAGQFSGPVGLSSLIIGCGYGGLSIDNSIHSILQGVVNANDRITGLYGEKAKLIEEVEFIEQYQDRALGCFYAIHNMGKGMGGVLNILPGDAIRERHGSRLMVSVDQGKDWWSRITICAVRNEDKKDVVEGMQFAISTGAAREEARELCTIGGVIDRLIETISVSRDWSQEKAAAIFELLMPNDFKARLKRHGNIAWVLDKYTAGYPWELLQHKGAEAKPLCINAGMIRQLSTSNSRLNIEIVTNQKALVIGDPQLKGFLPQLLGAETEAQSVTDVLLKHNYDVTPLIRREQDIIVQKLMSGSYRIIHLAGHGIFNRDCPRLSGMVIGKDNFLTTTQIAQMSDTPDLVFVNCCYLGNIDLKAEEYSQARYRLAANIGTQLIENGVKAVVVAGWAVNDAAANRFAEQFYTNMFAGKPFGEAVRAARETIYNEFPGNNTWGRISVMAILFPIADG